MRDRPTFRLVHKAVNRRLTVCGVERRLFFLALEQARLLKTLLSNCTFDRGSPQLVDPRSGVKT